MTAEPSTLLSVRKSHFRLPVLRSIAHTLLSRLPITTSSSVHRGRGVEGLLPLRGLELPGDPQWLQVDREHLVRHRADVEVAAQHRRRRPALALQIHAAELLPVLTSRTCIRLSQPARNVLPSVTATPP